MECLQYSIGCFKLFSVFLSCHEKVKSLAWYMNNFPYTLALMISPILDHSALPGYNLPVGLQTPKCVI